MNKQKRLMMRLNLNPWNYALTVAYDDREITEEQFKRRLKRVLAELNAQNGWKYIGVWQRAPQIGRLDFHAVVYVPETDEQGIRRICDCFFRSEFVALSEFDSYGYLLRAAKESTDRVVYSRGLTSYNSMGELKAAYGISPECRVFFTGGCVCSLVGAVELDGETLDQIWEELLQEGSLKEN